MAANNQNFRVKYGLDVTENLNVTGDLTVNGAIQLSNSVTIENLTVTGNAEITAALSTQNTSLVFSDGLTLSDAPGSNVSVTVNRGSSANVELSWNEVNDRWEFTNDGSNRYPLKTYDDNYSFTFDNSVTDTDSDPGDNTIIFNSANNAAANVIAVDNKIVGGANVAAFLATLDDGNSDPSGTIVIKDIDDTTKTQSFTYTSVDANTGFVRFLGVNCIETANVEYANGDTLALNFIRYGDKGQKGEKGQKGQKGELGQKGEQISSASFDDGTNTTTFTNSDASTFNLVGLKGQKGEKGEKGQKGELGVKGDKGDTALTGNTVVAAFAESNTATSTRNMIINGDMTGVSRGSVFTDQWQSFSRNYRNNYTLDRWQIQAEADNVIDVYRSSVSPNGEAYSIALDCENSGYKYGICQKIDYWNCREAVAANTVTLSFKAKVSNTATLDTIKAGIVSWTGSGNAMTGSLVQTWNVSGTNPTLNSFYNFDNTPANLNVTTDWETYTVTASLVNGLNVNNLVAFIWVDVTDVTVGDVLYITNVQMEQGTVATQFERMPEYLKQHAFRRYFTRQHQYDSSTFTGIGGFDNTYNDGIIKVNTVYPHIRGGSLGFFRKLTQNTSYPQTTIQTRWNDSNSQTINSQTTTQYFTGYYSIVNGNSYNFYNIQFGFSGGRSIGGRFGIGNYQIDQSPLSYCFQDAEL